MAAVGLEAGDHVLGRSAAAPAEVLGGGTEPGVSDPEPAPAAPLGDRLLGHLDRAGCQASGARHFRTFCHNRWNGRSSRASGLFRNGWVERLQDLWAGNAALTAQDNAVEDEVARFQAHLDKVEGQLERFRAEELWDRVMREVAKILTGRGAMTPAEILPELRA